jgi:hypothetical protein
MTCPAQWARFAPNRPAEFRRTLFALASVFVVFPLGAAETTPPVAAANYSGGAAQLRVIATSQEAQGRRGVTAKLELQLEIPPAEKAGSAGELPADFYLDNDATPLLSASVVAGKNLAKTAHAWSIEGKTGRVTINDLDIGEARLRLQGVEFELVLTKVTQWETIVFQASPGRSDFFQCGPFELRSSGEAQQFRVDMWAYPQFKAQHDAYRQRMPVTFLNHIYAMQQIKVVDAANRMPTSTGSSVPSTGAVSSTYSSFRAAEGDGAAAAAPEGDAISYPVSMTMRLPKRFEKERVKFRFDVIPLPAPAPAARPR